MRFLLLAASLFLSTPAVAVPSSYQPPGLSSGGGQVTGPVTAQAEGLGQRVSLLHQSPLTTGDPYHPPNAFILGGLSAGLPMSVMLRCHPYGDYDNGTCLSIVATPSAYTGSRAGISGGMENPATMAADGLLDSANEFLENGSIAPRLVVSTGVTYDATHAYFSPALATAQIAALRKGAYIGTNSVGATPTATGTFPQPNYYASTILGWAANGSSITVTGWVVPGGGNSAAGQVPGRTLDTTFTSYGTPTVLIGEPNETFNSSLLSVYDPTIKGSLVRQLQGTEWDFIDRSGGTHDVGIRGLSVNFSPQNGGVPSQDSYAAYLGGPLPLMLGMSVGGDPDGSVGLQENIYSGGPTTAIKIVNAQPTTVMLQSASSLINGNGGLPGGAGVVGTRAEMSEQSAYANGTNNMRLVKWLQQDTTADGYTGVSVRIGLDVDGTQGTPQAAPAGQVAWDPSGCIGCVGVYGLSGTGLTISATGESMSSSAVENRPLATPASSSAACTTGDQEADANYVYICVATNTWKRTALGSF